MQLASEQRVLVEDSVGLVEANELAMTDWACCRLRLGMVWGIPS